MSGAFVSRRRFLHSALLAATTLSSPLILTKHAFAQPFRNDPRDQKSAKFGFCVPLSGPYASEGIDEKRGIELAIRHLNGEGSLGMINTMTNCALTGNGVLGKPVEGLFRDTETHPVRAVAGARDLIENENCIMVCGGSASNVVIAMQNLCHLNGIIFMAGLSHSNDTTGIYRKRYGFRHFFNAHMTASALAPILGQSLGPKLRAYYLSADYNWGRSQEESLKTATESLGWQTSANIRTPLGLDDFTPFIAPVLDSESDVLVLNHYSGDLVRVLRTVHEMGVRDKRDIKIVAPLFSRLMAQGAGEAIKGVIGTANWNWTLQDPGSQSFVRAFSQSFGSPPSQAAHTCYVQTLLYANACEIAKSFDPVQVIKVLEDFEFDGMGNGPTLYRGADHQCFKDVLVVQGSENPISQFDVLDIVKVAKREEVYYPPDFFPGALGPYVAEPA